MSSSSGGNIPSIPVYVINLDHRSDRWETIRKQCFSAGIHPIRISAVKADPGWHGCGLSHKKVAEAAESAGHPWYLVLEDDATFSVDDWRRFMAVVPYLWNNRDKWDIFTGGHGTVTHFEMISTDPILYHVKGACTHFLLVHQKAYNVIKSWTIERYHFDHYLKEASKMVGTYPFISMQLKISSDINIGDPVADIDIGHENVKEKLKELNLIETFANISPPQVPVYVINLDHRQDRWEVMQKKCSSAGIQPTRISAVKASPGWHGCGFSHKKVAQAAQAAGHSWYVVLEDDAEFSVDDWKRFMKIVPYLWEHRDKWDIFNGGFGSVEHFKLVEREPILYEGKGYCSHFYFVNKRAFKAMAEWTPEKQALDNYAKNMMMWGTYPFISTQADSKSDLSDTNGPQHIIKDSENKIKQLIDNAQKSEGFISINSPNNILSRLLSLFSRY